MSAERVAAIARLEAWARQRGAQFDAIELRVDAAGNATTYARRALVAGEPIITIPRQLIVSERTFGGTPAVWFALEARRADSPWRPFLDALPTAFPDLPLFRAPEELALLRGTTAFHLASAAHRDAVEAHASLAEDLRGRISFADYAWARAVTQTRAFSAPFAVDNQPAFIPIVDMMDHGEGDTAWRFGRAGYTISTARAFEPGEPVRFEYGAHGNAFLLIEYGFALPDNPHDEAALAARDDAATAAGVRRALEELARFDPGIDPAASAWHHACDCVRRGEQRGLVAILARREGREA